MSYARWPNKWDNYTDSPYSQHNNHWPDWDDARYVEHDDYVNVSHADEGTPHRDSPHGDWPNEDHADQEGKYLNYDRYSNRPYQKYSDYEKVSHSDHDDHANSPSAGHLDSPRYEGNYAAAPPIHTDYYDWTDMS